MTEVLDLTEMLKTPAGMVLALIVIHAVFFVIPFWRICKRAGFSGALSLIVIIPLLGELIVTAILSFSNWPKKPSFFIKE